MQFTHRQGHSIARFISAVLLAEAEVERARRGATATQALEAGLAARASTCRIDSAQLLVPTAAFSAVAAAAADTMAALETVASAAAEMWVRTARRTLAAVLGDQTQPIQGHLMAGVVLYSSAFLASQAEIERGCVASCM